MENTYIRALFAYGLVFADFGRFSDLAAVIATVDRFDRSGRYSRALRRAYRIALARLACYEAERRAA